MSMHPHDIFWLTTIYAPWLWLAFGFSFSRCSGFNEAPPEDVCGVAADDDVETIAQRIAPEDDPAYTHTSEGPDDMPSHIRSMVTDVSVSIPVCAGTLMLGTWQGVYLCEHRRASHSRQLIVVVTPEIPS